VFGSLPDAAEYGTPEYRAPDEAVQYQVGILRGVAQRLPVGQCASLELALMHWTRQC